MKGYIYTMYKGADPASGWAMTDPIFGAVPTMGACMPNIRRAVEKGDFIFTISGQSAGVSQYVVGGFEVDEKISALAAYVKLPENRQRKMNDGSLRGNIIIDKNGNQSAVDYHSNFEKRIENYIIGKNPLVLETPSEVEIAREETLEALSGIFKIPGRKVSDVIGRWRRLSDFQIDELREWILKVKKNARLKPNEEYS